jgi:putative hemolysin
MKNLIILFVVLLLISGSAYMLLQQGGDQVDEPTKDDVLDQTATSMANPASEHCLNSGGNIEMVTNTDGSQFGMCQLEEYMCEEWAYYRGECTVDEDAEKIKEVLINKGLNLTDMKVVIQKHLGKYMAGGVVPVSIPAGGGYVFAAKDDAGNISIVADGNGAIMCSILEGYTDFPTYLIPECINEAGNSIAR